MRFTNWTGVAGILRWYAVAVGGFLFVRAISTLAGGASFAVPGTGWRSLFQLVAVAILVAGLVRPKAMRAAVAAVTLRIDIAGLPPERMSFAASPRGGAAATCTTRWTFRR